METYRVQWINRNGSLINVPRDIGVIVDLDRDKKTVLVKNDIAELTPGQGTFVSERESGDKRYITCHFDGDKNNSTIITSFHPNK